MAFPECRGDYKILLITREKSYSREGQTDSTSVDKYCSTWTNKGDYLYNGEGQTGSTPMHRQIVFYLD